MRGQGFYYNSQGQKIREVITAFIAEKYSLVDLRGISVLELLNRDKPRRKELIQIVVARMKDGIIASKYSSSEVPAKKVLNYAQRIVSEVLHKDPNFSKPRSVHLHREMAKRALPDVSAMKNAGDRVKVSSPSRGEYTDAEIASLALAAAFPSVPSTGEGRYAANAEKKKAAEYFLNKLYRTPYEKRSDDWQQLLEAMQALREEAHTAEVLAYLANMDLIRLSQKTLDKLSEGGIEILCADVKAA